MRFIKTRPCILETGDKMPHKMLTGPSCDLDLGPLELKI